MVTDGGGRRGHLWLGSEGSSNTRSFSPVGQGGWLTNQNTDHVQQEGINGNSLQEL